MRKCPNEVRKAPDEAEDGQSGPSHQVLHQGPTELL